MSLISCCFTDHMKIGIEVTDLCREEPRAEAGRLAKVPDNPQPFLK